MDEAGEKDERKRKYGVQCIQKNDIDECVVVGIVNKREYVAIVAI